MTVRAFLLFWLAVALTPQPADAQTEGALEKLVIVSRHGVRTPIATTGELDQWAARPWPAWQQPAGNLTLRGAELATLMGRWYRDYMSAQRAMPPSGCPVAGSVYFYADVAERTQATARALLDGFAPGCDLAFRTRGSVQVDPLFHPVSAGVCRIDPTVAERRVRERAGGDVERFARRLEPAFDVLQSVLECCGRALCREFGRGESCTLPDLPTRLASRPNDGGVAMTGALPIASTASEILLLEYGDGRPLDDVGWGRVTPDTLRETLRLHTAHYELTQRTPYLARKMGSALLATVSAAVTGRAEPGTQAPDPAVRDAKFVAYVGHDTNIWNIAGMLDVSWEQPGYQRNQTPPAGALVFEVRRWSDGKLRVQTSYVAQSLAQMRAGAPLTVERPPLRAALRIPGCSGAAPGHACTLDEFALAVRRVLDRNCVQ